MNSTPQHPDEASPDTEANSEAVVSEAEAMPALNEAKMVVVGREAVGKTSLVRFLTTGEPRDVSEPKTIGIHRKLWAPAGDQGPALNVWDFGGQEMQLQTHKFFLTERSLYLIVLEARREDDDAIYEWLRTVSAVDNESPVIVVINKTETDQDRFLVNLDERRLRDNYPQIASIVHTSCDDTNYARERIEDLRAQIVSAVRESADVLGTDARIPTSWLAVKESIESLSAEHDVLPYGEYVRLCLTGPAERPIENRDEQASLLLLLHQTGSVIAHGMSRVFRAHREEITLLNPNWLTRAIYGLIRDREIEAEPEFELARIGEVVRERPDLDESRYPPERYDYIVSLMESIGLAYQIGGSSPTRYLIPSTLNPSAPAGYVPYSGALKFRYRYEYLPPGLIPRFIVIAHHRLEGTNNIWRNGAILAAEGCRVAVTASREERLIEITVDGPRNRRRSALSMIREDLERVNSFFPESAPVAYVPLPDEPTVDIPYEHLLRLEVHDEASYWPVGASAAIRVDDLLNGVRSEPQALEFDDSAVRRIQQHERPSTAAYAPSSGEGSRVFDIELSRDRRRDLRALTWFGASLSIVLSAVLSLSFQEPLFWLFTLFAPLIVVARTLADRRRPNDFLRPTPTTSDRRRSPSLTARGSASERR